jgi:hypothetical protein
MRLKFTDSEISGEQRLDLPLDVLRVYTRTLNRTNKCLHQKRLPTSFKRAKRTLEASQKLSSSCALFAVFLTSLDPALCSSPASPSFFALPIVYIIVDSSPHSAERCGGISRRSRRSRRKGSQRVSGCPSVRTSPLVHATNLPYSLFPLSPFQNKPLHPSTTRSYM